MTNTLVCGRNLSRGLGIQWSRPRKGDTFCHPKADPWILTVERISISKSTGAKCVVFRDWVFPVSECRPIGLYAEAVVILIEKLEQCDRLSQVTALLHGFSDTEQIALWNACPKALATKIANLSAASAPPASGEKPSIGLYSPIWGMRY